MCLSAAMLSADVFYAIKYPRAGNANKTLNFIQIFFDITSATTSLLMHIVCLAQSSLVADIIQFLQDHNMESVWENHMYTYPILKLFFASPILLSVFFITDEGNQSLNSTLLFTYKVGSLILFYLYIGLLYHNILDYVRVRLRLIFQPFVDQYDMKCIEINNFNKTLSKIEPSSSDYNVSFPKQRSRCREIDEESFMFHSADYDQLKDEILRLFYLQRLVKDFSARPLTILMFCLIIWLLNSAFYFTTMFSASWYVRGMAISHSATTLTSLFYLLNSSIALHRQVMHHGLHLGY